MDVVLGLVPIDDDRSLRALLEDDLGIDLAIDARGRAIQAPAEPIGGTWPLGSGMRARQLGLLTIRLESGAIRFRPDAYDEQLEADRETFRKRIAQLDERLAGPIQLDDDARRRLESQRDAYARKVDAIGHRLQAIRENVYAHRFATRAIDLSDAIADHPATEALVVAAKQRITESAGVDPARFVPRMVAEGPYAGGEACVPCHRAEHAQWSGTGHAHAWKTLVSENRAFDSDCWTCHVTGANQAGGPPSATASGGWRDVQCEACHGPSRAHAASPATVDSVREPPLATCTSCHDGDQDGGRIVAEVYVPQVRHSSASPQR